MNNQQEFDKLMRAQLEQMTFPAEHIFPAFRELANIALEHESMFSMRIDHAVLKSLYRKCTSCNLEDFNTYEISYAINAIIARTPADIKLFGEEYLAAMELSKFMYEVWQELVTPVRTSILRKIDTQQRIAVPGRKKDFKL